VSERKPKPKRDLDERTKIDLPPEQAMQALLRVDPEAKPQLSDEDVQTIIDRALADEESD